MRKTLIVGAGFTGAELVEHFNFAFGEMAVDRENHEAVGECGLAEFACGAGHFENGAEGWVEHGAESFGGLQAVFAGED